MYGRLINGSVVKAPCNIIVGSQRIYNPTDTMLEAEGYKPIVNTDRPADKDGFYFVSSWEESKDAITQVWTEVEIPEQPEPEEPVATQIENILTGREAE